MPDTRILPRVDTLRLPVKQPFNFRYTLWKPSHFATGLERHSQERSWRTFRIGELVCGVVLTMDSSDMIWAEVYSDGPWQEADRDRLSARLIHSYGLDEDISAFVALAEQVPPMREPLAALAGMRQSCPENLFEIAIISLLLQNATVARTTQMMTNLLDHCGLVTEFGGVTLKAFFTPEEIAGIAEATFRERDRLGYRAKYIGRFAEFFMTHDPDEVDHASKAELMTEFQTIKGVGPYTAARLHHDRLPRDPLPTVVAHLISDTLDREVSFDQLWSGRAKLAQLWVPADAGMNLPWTAAGTVEMLDDWLGHTGGSIGMDRRIFLAVSGAALTAPAWEYADRLGTRGGSFAALADDRRSITVTSAMVDAVTTTTAGIRNLGNTEGGHKDNLRFVHHHLTWVAKLLRQARFNNSAVADRLFAEWAQLAQLAAWMANDAGQHGLSQRYFTSGLHAAHTAGDRSVGAYLLACMSQTAVHRGRLGDGIDLGRAARDAVELANAAHEAAKSTPAVVRAVAASAFAQAQAAVGNARGFHSSADEARALLDTPGALDNLPPYLAWFWPANLESCLAQGALTLAGVTSRDCRILLDGADAVLGRTGTDPAGTPRNAVFHVAWLSRAHLAAGDLDRAVPAAQVALRRLPTVRSRRCELVLRRLEADLAVLPPTHRPPAVRSLQDQLRATNAARPSA